MVSLRIYYDKVLYMVLNVNLVIEYSCIKLCVSLKSAEVALFFHTHTHTHTTGMQTHTSMHTLINCSILSSILVQWPSLGFSKFSGTYDFMAHLASKFLMLLKILCVSPPEAVPISFLCPYLKVSPVSLVYTNVTWNKNHQKTFAFCDGINLRFQISEGVYFTAVPTT